MKLPPFIRRSVPFAAAIVLLAGLIAASGVSGEQLTHTLRQLPASAMIGVFVCSAVLSLLSTAKWLIVLDHLPQANGQRPSFSHAFFSTSLGALLSLVLMPQISMVIARGYAEKRRSGGAPLKSTAATLYEQFFDVVPIVAFALAALYCLLAGANWAVLWAMGLLLVVAGSLAMIMLFRLRSWLYTTLARLLPRMEGSRVFTFIRWTSQPEAERLFSPQFISTLMLMSFGRYLAIMGRSYFVFAAVVLSLGFSQFTQAYSLVSISRLLSLTPGGLGISEWTWAGVLALFNVDFESSVNFSLANRITNIGAAITIALSSYILLRVIASNSTPSSTQDRNEDC